LKSVLYEFFDRTSFHLHQTRDWTNETWARRHHPVIAYDNVASYVGHFLRKITSCLGTRFQSGHANFMQAFLVLSCNHSALSGFASGLMEQYFVLVVNAAAGIKHLLKPAQIKHGRYSSTIHRRITRTRVLQSRSDRPNRIGMQCGS
jgi:hypothetical protein